MSDQYRIPDRPRVPAPHRAVRIALWAVLIPTAGFNAASSFLGQTTGSLAAGIVATVCIAGLIASHVTGRRR